MERGVNEHCLPLLRRIIRKAGNTPQCRGMQPSVLVTTLINKPHKQLKFCRPAGASPAPWGAVPGSVLAVPCGWGSSPGVQGRVWGSRAGARETVPAEVR